jgi:uncharacterized protein (TIGR02678 family)
MSERRVIDQPTDDIECQDAMRLLLRHPLVTSDGPHAEAFATIRRHRDRLAKDFRQLLGYRLAVESGYARLCKSGLGHAGARPLHRRSGAPFSPRAYTYLSLCCAVLLTSRQQVLLSSLVEDVRHAGTEAGITWGDDTTVDRRAFVAAVLQLVGWGVLVEDDGTVEAYADNSSAEALLYVRRDLVRHLLAVPLREVERPSELVAAAVRPGIGGARHRVRRLLVETPAVTSDDVDVEGWAWLRESQRREAGIFRDAFGLELEIRAEGVAAIDPLDDLTDITFPRGGTLGHAALLTVSELVRRLRPATVPARDAPAVTSVAIPADMIDDITSDLLEQHPKWWSKDYVEHPERLPRDVVDLLVSMHLVRRVDTGADSTSLRLSAIAARYAPDITEPPPPEVLL